MGISSAGTTMSVQFNVRMDRRLKEDGDRALAAASITPSQAVRSLWGRLAAHANDPDSIQEIVEPSLDAAHGMDPDASARADKGHALAVKGVSLFFSAIDGMGVSISSLATIDAGAQDDRMLLESELLDHLANKGLDR